MLPRPRFSYLQPVSPPLVADFVLLRPRLAVGKPLLFQTTSKLSPLKDVSTMDLQRLLRRAFRYLPLLCGLTLFFLAAGGASASEADLAIPDLHEGKFNLFGTEVSAGNLLAIGALVICGTL